MIKMRIYKPILLFTTLLMITCSIKTQWTQLPTGNTFGFQAISAVDDNIVWAAGGNIYRSTNGGATWLNSTGTGIDINSSMINIFAFDGLTAIVSGYKAGTPQTGLSYKTTNGGVSWFTIFSQQDGFVDAVWMRNATEGILVGDPVANFWSIYKTTNGGNNWFQSGVIPAGTGEAGAPNSLCIVGDNVWFGANTNGWLYYSSNFGASWVKQNLTSSYGPYAIYFINATTGMCGGPSHVHYTTNSGASWIALTYPGTGFVNGIAANGSFWLISKYGRSVYSSTNSGSNWSLEYQTPDSSLRSHMSKSRTGIRVWEVRNNGIVGRRDGPLGISILSNEVPLENSLKQNYPNPFNPETRIKFEIRQLSFVKLNVYDVRGRVIRSIIEESLNPGQYEYTFYAEGIPSGIYFYKLETENFKEVKKMMFIK